MIRGVLLRAGLQANGDTITPEAVQQAAKAFGVMGGKVTYNHDTQSMELVLPSKTEKDLLTEKLKFVSLSKS